jgi:ribosomal protein S18 acetylase RimI-like enzyme
MHLDSDGVLSEAWNASALTRGRCGSTVDVIMSETRIEPLTAAQREAAASMLARAFVTNPLHVAAFGPDRLAANEAFFRTGLAKMKGSKLVATDGTRILGVIHWVSSPDCQFSPVEKLATMPAMIGGLGLRAALRLTSWLSAWARHDPAEPHAHLGPIGVDPHAQGRHIGHQLMQRYCDEIDGAGQLGFLETDRPENVQFYQRFGFELVATAPVLGTPNYFMSRKPGHLQRQTR